MNYSQIRREARSSLSRKSKQWTSSPRLNLIKETVNPKTIGTVTAYIPMVKIKDRNGIKPEIALSPKLIRE